jgi:hypothetical protein
LIASFHLSGEKINRWEMQLRANVAFWAHHDISLACGLLVAVGGIADNQDALAPKARSLVTQRGDHALFSWLVSRQAEGVKQTQTSSAARGWALRDHSAPRTGTRFARGRAALKKVIVLNPCRRRPAVSLLSH